MVVVSSVCFVGSAEVNLPNRFFLAHLVTSYFHFVSEQVFDRNLRLNTVGARVLIAAL